MSGDRVARGGGAVGTTVDVRGLGVRIRDGGTAVVEGVSLSIAPGEVLGLVGESGSGKSTLAVALLGHVRRGLEITGGSVRIGSTDVLSLRGAELARARGRIVAYVPQDPASGLNPALRVGRQLAEAIAVHPGVLDDAETVADRVERLLDDVKLPSSVAIVDAYPHQLSGGQQQRVAIAMAFACRPALIVLDEPTTGLDVMTQRHVLDTIRGLTSNYHATALYVSHDLPVVAEIANDVAVMYAGRLVELGPTATVFTFPRHHYTAGLMAAVPNTDDASALVGMEGHAPRPGQWPAGCSFASRCPSARSDCRERVPELRSEGESAVRCFHPRGQRFAMPRARTSCDVSHSTRGALVASHVTAQYGTKPVLHDVSIAVEPGACVAIVGESGSGKTTLARCVIGLHSKWRGEMTFDGAALAPAAQRRTAQQRRRIQYVFQNPYGSLNPRMTVAENVGESLRCFESLSWRERSRRVLATLDGCALSETFADRMPDELSGGERQRVALARALIVQPELLICDEVTSALDVSVQAVLVEQLRSLQQERGIGILFITHNLAVVRSIAQQVVVLRQGAVAEAGPTPEVLSAPRHPYTKDLLEVLPRLAPVGSGRDG